MAKINENMDNEILKQNLEAGQQSLQDSSDIGSNLQNPNFTLQDVVGTIYESQARDATLDLAAQEESSLSPEAIKEMQMEQAFGDKDLKAAALGAARGLTFGASDLVLDKAGLVSKEEQDALRSVNPVSSTVGEIGGFIPTFGAGGVARGAGTLASKVVKGIIKESGQESFVKDLVKRSIITGADFGADAGTYLLGSALTEAALGDAPFNADNLLAGVSASAFIGAGTGALGRTVKGLSPFVGGAVKRKMDDITDSGSAFLELNGYRNATQKVNIKRLNPGIEERGPDLMRRAGVKITDTKPAAETMAEFKNIIGNQLEGVYDDIDDVVSIRDSLMNRKAHLIRMINEEQLLKPDVVLDPMKLYNFTNKKQFDKSLLNASSTDNILAEEIYHAIRKIDDQLMNVKPGDAVSVKEYWNKRKKVDGQINYMAPNKTKESARSRIAVSERTAMQELLEKKVQSAKGTEGYNELKRLNRDYSDLAALEKGMKRELEDSGSKGSLNDTLTALVLGGALGSGDPNLGTAGAAALIGSKFLKSDALRKIKVLSTVDKQNHKIAKTLQKSVDGFLNTSKTISRATGIVALKDFSLSYKQDEDTGKVDKPSNEMQAYENISANLTKYAADPASLVDEVQRRTYSLSLDAPDTAQQIQERLITGTQFLYEKMPKSPVEENGFTMFKRPYQPTSSELSKFQRYVETVDSPMTALQDFENKSITKEQVEALRVVYPELYSRIATTTMNEITQKGYDLNYEQRLQAGLLFNAVTDSSLQPENIVALQMLQAKTQNQNDKKGGETAVNPTTGGLKELGRAGAAASATQSFMQRKNSE